MQEIGRRRSPWEVEKRAGSAHLSSERILRFRDRLHAKGETEDVGQPDGAEKIDFRLPPLVGFRIESETEQ